MPNGGSDCCGTCWFNRKNRGEPGYGHAGDPGPARCEIREAEIDDPFWTYCANHPHRSAERDRVPIGPIVRGPSREVWRPSPDTEAIRAHLLALLARIEEPPRPEYPLGIDRDETVVWQLGEFREARAVPDLGRVAAFPPEATTGGPAPRTRASLVRAAREALAKIRAA